MNEERVAGPGGQGPEGSRLLCLMLVSSSIFNGGVGVERLPGSPSGGLPGLHFGDCSALVFFGLESSSGSRPLPLVLGAVAYLRPGRAAKEARHMQRTEG